MVSAALTTIIGYQGAARSSHPRYYSLKIVLTGLPAQLSG